MILSKNPLSERRYLYLEGSASKFGATMKYERKMGIGILTFPIGKAGITPLVDLVRILEPISRQIHLITGGEGYDVLSENERIRTYKVTHKTEGSVFLRIARYLATQIEMSYHLAKVGKRVEIWVFFIGGDTLVLPMVLAKALGRRVVLTFASSSSMILRTSGDRLWSLNKMASQINCSLADLIVLYSSRLISEWKMTIHRKKIAFATHHIPDLRNFRIEKEFATRDKLVGYVGRLSEEKGVLQFAKAIRMATKQDPELRFVIAGDGSMKDEIHQYVDKFGLGGIVRMTGWIPHCDLPSLLNELRLIVIPSYTEGLPNVMLEAMACGTPVLATSVGAIPDVIMEGETGFILEDNSPACIAKSISLVLESSKLEDVSGKAHSVVIREFQYEKAVSRWESILGVINEESDNANQ